MQDITSIRFPSINPHHLPSCLFAPRECYCLLRKVGHSFLCDQIHHIIYILWRYHDVISIRVSQSLTEFLRMIPSIPSFFFFENSPESMLEIFVIIFLANGGVSFLPLHTFWSKSHASFAALQVQISSCKFGLTVSKITFRTFSLTSTLCIS